MTTFDSKTWNDPEQIKKKPFPRRTLADELIRERTLHGKTRAEVVELLGEPTQTEYFADYDAVYWLGPQRGLMAIDSEWLVIRFGDDGRVLETQLKTD